MDKKTEKDLWIKKCPVFLLLLTSGIFLALVGMSGRNSLYADYPFEPVKTPYLALVMEGLEDGVNPFRPAAYEKIKETVSLLAETPEGILVDDAIIIPQSEEAEAVEESGKEEDRAVSGNDAVLSPAPSFTLVTEDYFNDAVFIGDSRTQGLFEYGGLEERADFFSKVSLTIYDVLTEPFIKDGETGKKITVEEALLRKQYGKVYLMLGINELGTGTTESFMEEYRRVAARIRELQPDAILFVEGIMRVTGDKNASDPIFNNTNINEKNREIEKLSDGHSIFYLDVNEAVCDEQGNLNAEYTVDQVHLKAQYYSVWKEFLLQHGIVR